MRPSTILLASFTVLFGAATIILVVLVGPGDPGGLAEVLRLGGLVTIGFGAGLVLSVTNRRRRDRLQRETAAHPGTVFVNAHTVTSTAADLEAWSPGLAIRFPCDLGFDHDGMTSWSGHDGDRGTLIARRDEITGLEVFDQRTPLGSTSVWGMVISLAPTTAGPGAVHLLTIDDQRNQDEYAIRRTISRIESALGR